MNPRFFVDSPISSERAKLVDREAHHLLHVLRLGEGSEVTLFDGSGAEFEARVASFARNEVELAVLARHEVDREVAAPITLGVALPKGDRQKWMVEKATELGVTKLVPLETERGVAQPVAKALERLRHTVIESSKQCRRNRLMEIAEPLSLSAYLSQDTDTTRRYLAHPAGGEFLPPEHSSNTRFETLLAIGPEGGFTDEEVAAATAVEWQIVDLGPRILRIETAAMLLTVLSS
ncbi:MAG: 16S rRNA (uracil(1498)-N(3))-methyltransferase [Pirellulales bacterium]|nr:16S rRNA (uracil(1498)-N(3))-methyltransferase [Pirellulales bacterium]